MYGQIIQKNFNQQTSLKNLPSTTIANTYNNKTTKKCENTKWIEKTIENDRSIESRFSGISWNIPENLNFANNPSKKQTRNINFSPNATFEFTIDQLWQKTDVHRRSVIAKLIIKVLVTIDKCKESFFTQESTIEVTFWCHKKNQIKMENYLFIERRMKFLWMKYLRNIQMNQHKKTQQKRCIIEISNLSIKVIFVPKTESKRKKNMKKIKYSVNLKAFSFWTTHWLKPPNKIFSKILIGGIT